MNLANYPRAVAYLRCPKIGEFSLQLSEIRRLHLPFFRRDDFINRRDGGVVGAELHRAARARRERALEPANFPVLSNCGAVAQFLMNASIAR